MQVFFTRLYRPGFLRDISTPSFQLFLRITLCRAYKNTSNMEDAAVPNDKWTKDSLELFNKLKMLTNQGEDWQKLKSYSNTRLSDGSVGRLFSRSLVENGKFLEYAYFCSPRLQLVKGVVQFGLYTMGPVGYAHGGAIATILDSAMSRLVDKCGYSASVTANLNVDYLRAVPVNSTVYVESRIDKVEGRKVFTSSAMKTVDESASYAKSTALFVVVSKPAL